MRRTDHAGAQEAEKYRNLDAENVGWHQVDTPLRVDSLHHETCRKRVLNAVFRPDQKRGALPCTCVEDVQYVDSDAPSSLRRSVTLHDIMDGLYVWR